MQTKKVMKKRRIPKRISLPEILQLAQHAYDQDGILPFGFSEVTSERGRIQQPSLTGDTLAEFIIRELGDVFNNRAGEQSNLGSAADAMNSAIRQLMAIEAALRRANYRPARNEAR